MEVRVALVTGSAETCKNLSFFLVWNVHHNLINTVSNYLLAVGGILTNSGHSTPESLDKHSTRVSAWPLIELHKAVLLHGGTVLPVRKSLRIRRPRLDPGTVP